jgi:DNA (cytosine-5)-methyltransferase 1
MPSPRYLPYFQYFLFPRKIAQLVVSSAKDRPLQRFDAFLARFTSMTDMFGKTYEEQHLWDSVCFLPVLDL